MRDIRFAAKIIGKFKSIQSAIFAVVTVLLLSAVLVITGVSMRYTRNSIFENSSVYTQNIVQQMNQNIDSYIDYMENIAYLISSSEDVQDYLFDDEINNEARYRILNQFETILDSRSDIRNVGIISKSGRMLINHGKKSVNSDLDLNTQEWYTQALDSPEGPKLTSSHVQHIISGERPWVITLSRGIRDREGSGEKEGVFFIDLNYSAISGLCDQSTVGTKGYAFIMDAKGNIVYHPQQQQLYNELQTENIDLIMKTDDDTVLTGTGKDGKLYSISRSEKTGWTVVDCTSVRELLSKSHQAQSVYVLTAILLVVVALLFSRFMARSITLPIQKLRDSMKKVQEGDFSVSDVVVDSENEIGSLTKSFDAMTHRIQELMEQNVYEQEQKRKSELKALQSQINPHFLYNTLDTINWMAQKYGADDISTMVRSLGNLFRAAVNSKEDLIPLKMELDVLKDYIRIQQIRFGDRLDFQLHVPDDISHIYVPTLCIQPLVENALKYALEFSDDVCHITVTISEKDTVYQITVANTGSHFEDDLIWKLEHRQVTPQGSGVGLVNINSRLKLLFGDRYGLSIYNEDGMAIVLLSIPKEREDSYAQIDDCR